MKQMVVIEVDMKCDECRSKALQIAFLEDGVISVTLKGERRNQIEVIGEGIVDSARLAKTLRKKVGFADILSVEEVKEKSS